MLDRKEIKAEAKRDFKANYWKSVLVSVIYSLLVGGSASASGRSVSDSAANQAGTPNSISEMKAYFAQNPELLKAIIAGIIVVVLVVMLVGSLMRIFLINPLGMGCRSFFLSNTENPNTDIGELKKGFNPYKRNIFALFLKDLFVFLWSLLFIIPGIMKSYSYTLTPFILSEDPNISARDALKKSEEMMKGHRWEAFKLDFSFVGWIILSVFTLGLLYVFYVGPYMFQADSEFYKKVKALHA
jgi:uncharacterized membrane protein